MELLAMACAGICSVLVVLVLAGVFVFGFRLPAAQKNAKVAGESLGLHQGPKHQSVHWWVGDVDGHAVGLVPVGLRSHTYVEGRRKPVVTPGVRLLVVAEHPPLEAVAYREVSPPSTDTSFDEAFQVDDASRIPADVRAAMLAYVQEHSGALRIRDRAGAPADLMPPSVYPEARVVVVGEHVDGTDHADLKARLDDLIDIARALEASR